MSNPALVCDTTLLLYLGRIGQAQLGIDLYQKALRLAGED